MILRKWKNLRNCWRSVGKTNSSGIEIGKSTRNWKRTEYQKEAQQRPTQTSASIQLFNSRLSLARVKAVRSLFPRRLHIHRQTCAEYLWILFLTNLTSDRNTTYGIFVNGYITWLFNSKFKKLDAAVTDSSSGSKDKLCSLGTWHLNPLKVCKIKQSSIKKN